MEQDPHPDDVAALCWLPSMQRVVIREYAPLGSTIFQHRNLGEVMFDPATKGEDVARQLFQRLAVFCKMLGPLIKHLQIF